MGGEDSEQKEGKEEGRTVSKRKGREGRGEDSEQKDGKGRNGQGRKVRKLKQTKWKEQDSQGSS